MQKLSKIQTVLEALKTKPFHEVQLPKKGTRTRILGKPQVLEKPPKPQQIFENVELYNPPIPKRSTINSPQIAPKPEIYQISPRSKRIKK